MKACSHCEIQKSLDDYYNHPLGKDGKRSICKSCFKQQKKAYQKQNPNNKIYVKRWGDKNPGLRRKRWNNWHKTKYKNDPIFRKRRDIQTLSRKRGSKISKSYRKELKLIYENRPKGFEVDHIIPIKGKSVCGLHVPWNLQYLTLEENRKKSNKVHPCL